MIYNKVNFLLLVTDWDVLELCMKPCCRGSDDGAAVPLCTAWLPAKYLSRMNTGTLCVKLFSALLRENEESVTWGEARASWLMFKSKKGLNSLSWSQWRRQSGPCPIRLWMDCSGRVMSVPPAPSLWHHSFLFLPFTPPPLSSLHCSVRVIWRAGLSWHEMGLTKETISLQSTPPPPPPPSPCLFS